MKDDVTRIVEFADSIVNPDEKPWTFNMTCRVVELLVEAATAAHEASYVSLCEDLPLAGNFFETGNIVVLGAGLVEDLLKEVKDLKNEEL